jgi:hypothetical protein
MTILERPQTMVPVDELEIHASEHALGVVEARAVVVSRLTLVVLTDRDGVSAGGMHAQWPGQPVNRERSVAKARARAADNLAKAHGAQAEFERKRG